MIIPYVLNQQPQQAVALDWSNPLTKDLVAAYLPGAPTDLVGSFGNAAFRGATSRQGTSLIMGGTTGNGIQFGSGPLLGPLTNSTIVVLGMFSTQGRVLYCERAPTGLDIYKLETATNGAQFTYRNDGNTLLQVVTPAINITGGPRLFAAVKRGSAHSIYCGPLGDGAFVTASNTYPSTPTFTNTGIVRSLGYDAQDATAMVGGRSDLVLCYSRALSAMELNVLRVNPWQVFKAPVSRLGAAILVAGSNSYSYTASGGLLTSGTANRLFTTSRTPSGGVLTSGTASVAPGNGTLSRTVVGSGGATLSGTASRLKGSVRGPSGGVTFSGTGNVIRPALPGAVGNRNYKRGRRPRTKQ